MAKEPKVDSIEERLKEHARSFEGLLSLIPAKHYYAQDTTDQWQKKKQTKEEARAARMAKLDPDNYRSAQDVLNEQQAELRKRKRAELQDEDSDVLDEGAGGSTGSKSQNVNGPGGKRKKIRTEEGSEQLDQRKKGKGAEPATKKSQQDRAAEKTEKRRQRQEKRKAKKMKRKEKSRKQEHSKQESTSEHDPSDHFEMKTGQPVLVEPPLEDAEDNENINKTTHASSIDSSSSRSLSPVFDASLDQSGSSSITSLPPPSPVLHEITTETPISKPATENETGQDPDALKRRLQARIEEFRTARKADDPQGLPRSRQELIDSRRQKEEARKAKKKEAKRKLKEEEAQKKAETLARGSPLLSPGSPLSARADSNKFAFGNVEFNDGQKLSADLSNIIQQRKGVKGPSDPATALLAAQKNDSRLASLDQAKRDDIAEKDSWLNARKRAQGERIRDDSNLLKKTLKRKQSQKKKSEKEWKERLEGVKKREEMKQKKREANLKQRRDEKGGKGKKNKGSKARPGFEGSFRAKAPSGKGKISK